jgi:hypothetical protein
MTSGYPTLLTQVQLHQTFRVDFVLLAAFKSVSLYLTWLAANARISGIETNGAASARTGVERGFVTTFTFAANFAKFGFSG